MTAIDRFWKYIEPEPNSGCWLWVGAQVPDGYGQFWCQGKMIYAHRWAYMHYRGPIPDGLCLDHKCHVRCCVNPDHLEPVTHTENVRRGESWKISGAKTHCPQGHPYDEANTILRKRGWRHCRKCMADNKRVRYWRLKGLAAR